FNVPTSTQRARSILRLTLALVYLLCCWRAFGQSDAPFEFHQSERVVLLGDTLIEREQLYASIEQRLTVEYPDMNVIFRNLGWIADPPAAVSRASFDFEKPEKGFERLKDQLTALQPTVVVLGYGMASSFDGQAGLGRFKTELVHLIETIRSGTNGGSVRFIV